MVRRLMEPRHWSDRILYALQMLMLPYSAAYMTRAGFWFCAIVMIALWVPMAFYTIEWILEKLVD